ncbi:MAG: hypothetical protein R2831_01190 [Chitinophagaceae bacterium]
MKKILLSLSILMLVYTVDAQKKKQNLGNNIITFMPVSVISDNVVGVGVSYERLVNEYVGIRVPVTVGINNSYVNLGVEAKLYPGKNNGAVRYAIAPMLMFGTGYDRDYYYNYDPLTGNYITTFRETERTHFGFLLNQTLNITIAKNFFLGLDGGIGLNYYDSKAYNYNYNNTKLSFAGQLNFGLGVRF